MFIETPLESTCPVHGTPGVVLGYSGNTDVYQCPECELCYLGKSVRPQSFLDNQWYEGFSQHVEWGERFLAQLAPAYYRQLNVLESLTAGRHLADVGCGVGVFLAAAKESHWDVFGIEESPYAAGFAKQAYGLDYVPHLHSVKPSSLDVVRLSHVLEHIPEPVAFLQEVKRLLKPNGILSIIVPNREPLCCKLTNATRRVFSNKIKLAGAIYPNMHVLGFSVSSLTSLVTSQGFKKESAFTISMGNPTYFPLFYDGLLNLKDPRTIPLKELAKHWLPMLVNNLGNRLGWGEWIVGYFRKL